MAYVRMLQGQSGPCPHGWHFSLQADPAAPVAPSNGPHWRLLKQVILQTLRPQQGLLVVPYLVG